MRTHLTGEDHVLLTRYLESVLLRYSDGKYSLGEATDELAQAFTRVAQGQADVLAHLRGVIEAGDDA